jgi:hypothetical protein
MDAHSQAQQQVHAEALYDCQNFSSPFGMESWKESDEALPSLLSVRVAGHAENVKKSKCSSMYGISAQVIGRCESGNSFLNAHTQFTIHVRNGWSTTTVYRRYSEFAVLERQLRAKMSSLPALPPKAFFRKLASSIMNDPSFMNDRERGLGKLLETMISSDPALRSPELRDFLGVIASSLDGR